MNRPILILAAVALLLAQEGAAAQDVPVPAQDAGCAALRAEVAQIERDMRTESTAMSKAAEDMRKKSMSRAKAARTTGMLTGLAGMIPGVGMAASLGGSLLSRAASGGGGMGMPKAMEEAMARQTVLSDRMTTASQALQDRCGGASSGPTMSREEVKAMMDQARNPTPN